MNIESAPIVDCNDGNRSVSATVMSERQRLTSAGVATSDIGLAPERPRGQAALVARLRESPANPRLERDFERQRHRFQQIARQVQLGRDKCLRQSTDPLAVELSGSIHREILRRQRCTRTPRVECLHGKLEACRCQSRTGITQPGKPSPFFSVPPGDQLGTLQRCLQRSRRTDAPPIAGVRAVCIDDI